MHRYVLMGVSGCGKTSVGIALARRCDVRFIDGDDLHPAANIAKMSAGLPLSDEDRAPWLADVGRALAAAQGTSIIGCSALKRQYRDWIRAQAGGTAHFLHLDAPKDVLQTRVANRPGHFMPPDLLDSQFDALEPLGTDEDGRKIDISGRFSDVLRDAETYLRETMT